VTEEQQLRTEALKADRLESLGILAGGIAHDFNNALLVISGNLQMARIFECDDPRHTTLLHNAEQASIRARDLTQQLLTFAKGGTPVKEVAAIDALVRDTALFAVSGSNVRCEFDVATDLRAVEVDLGQISQVVNNLVINADQAMPAGGTMRIGLHNVTLDETSPIPLPAGDYLCVNVADTGTGISPEHLDRIFDPYFTTKSKGSGLGLASCYSIIQQHGGHLGVTSELGVGSTFSIYLPTSDRQASAQDAAQQAIPTGAGRILVMDDEEAVRELAAILLGDLGYTVEMAVDGEEAVARYRDAMAAGEPFAAVILDLTIRGAMGGIETIAVLRALDPGVRAVVCSGYSADPVMAQYREYGFCAVVVKPYDVGELAEAVARAVNGD
jgi:CheY-like chemotaxis protein